MALALKPKLIIEIGTETGSGTLAMRKFLPQDSKIATFDIFGWKTFPTAEFKESDFADGRLVQYIDDLSNPSVFSKYRQLLQEAGMIFIDAAKDGINGTKDIGQS